MRPARRRIRNGPVLWLLDGIDEMGLVTAKLALS